MAPKRGRGGPVYPEEDGRAEARAVKGSIFRRKDGRWVFEISVDGRKRPYYARSEAEARAKRDEVLALLDTRLAAGGPKQTLRAFVRRWLSDVKRHEIREHSLCIYQNHVDRALKYIGGVKLGELTTGRIQWCYSQLRDEGYAPASIHSTHTVLRQALEQAVEWELIAKNPVAKARPPRPTPTAAQHVLTEEDVAALLAAAADDPFWSPFFIVLAATGMRVGELIPLTWDDVDLEAGTLRVERTVTWVTGEGRSTIAPKSRAGRRTIRLAAPALEALRARRRLWREASLQSGDRNPLVFPDRRGGWVSNGTVRDRLRRYLTRAGLDPIRVHDLRHTAATLLLEDGERVHAVSKMLGHAGIGITLGTYGHVTDSMEQGVADRMTRILSARSAQAEHER